MYDAAEWIGRKNLSLSAYLGVFNVLDLPHKEAIECRYLSSCVKSILGSSVTVYSEFTGF